MAENNGSIFRWALGGVAVITIAVCGALWAMLLGQMTDIRENASSARAEMRTDSAAARAEIKAEIEVLQAKDTDLREKLIDLTRRLTDLVDTLNAANGYRPPPRSDPGANKPR